MNWFLIANGFLLLGGSAWSFIHYDWQFGVIYLCWSVPSFILGAPR